MSFVFWIVVAVLALWVITTYNALISLKNRVANAWKQIDVQLKRRHDLIPNLVNTVKGAMSSSAARWKRSSQRGPGVARRGQARPRRRAN
jgi:LemA protein